MIDYTTLPATHTLFHVQPYLKETHAIVVAIDDCGVALDQTIFYPAAGGQPTDVGLINGDISVTSVSQEGGTPLALTNGQTVSVGTIIRHQLEGEHHLTVGQEVSLAVDWDRRFAHMQLHSLAHLMFMAVDEYLRTQGQAAETRGCEIGQDSARLDFVGAIPAEAITELETRVRDLLSSTEPAVMIPEEHDTWSWNFLGFRIPCYGTHVIHTDEINGDIRLKRRSKGAGSTRLTIELDRPAIR